MAKIKTNKQSYLAFIQTNPHPILAFLQTNYHNWYKYYNICSRLY